MVGKRKHWPALVTQVTWVEVTKTVLSSRGNLDERFVWWGEDLLTCHWFVSPFVCFIPRGEFPRFEGLPGRAA